MKSDDGKFEITITCQCSSTSIEIIVQDGYVEIICNDCGIEGRI
jgi:hypothetical protein